jgi:hypothetical protein
MRVIVNSPVLIGGVWFDPDPLPQTVQDAVGGHLIDIGAATRYEEKIVSVTEKKSPDLVSFASPLDQVSPEPIAKPRRGRPPKSLS